MKILGTTFLAICPLIMGLEKSFNFKKNIYQLEKIIELINWIITEIRYKKTDIYNMFYSLSLKENFKNLEFLQYIQQYIKTEPFPAAWKKSIEKWQCFIKKDDKELLKSLSNVIGALDCKEQITSLKYVCTKFENSLTYLQKNYYKKAKLWRSLGGLTGAAIFIIFI